VKILLIMINLIILHLFLLGEDKVISGGTSFLMEKVPIASLTPYRLSFSAKVDGPGNFEDSPQLEYLFMNADKAKMGRKMAGWKIIFYDSLGREIKLHYASFWKCVFSKKIKLYNDEFYTPDGAAFLSVEFAPGEIEDKVCVSSPVLKKIDTSMILNLNPEFKLGPYNYSGIGQLSGGKMMVTEEGVTKLDLRNGWAVGNHIPVRPGENLQISVSATGFKKMGAVLKFNYYNTEGNEISRDRANLRIPQGEEKVLSYDFIVPDNANSIKIILGGAVYNWIKLERILK